MSTDQAPAPAPVPASAPVPSASVPMAVPAASPAQRRRLILAGVAIVGALAFLVVRGLGDAAVYFKTTTEAVQQRASLGTRRFRLEGIVEDGSVRQENGVVRFVVSQDGASVQVRHRGDPPELFQCNVPVVLEGHYAAGSNIFESDRVLIKHDNQYAEANPTRLKEYIGKDKFRCSGSPTVAPGSAP